MKLKNKELVPMDNATSSFKYIFDELIDTIGIINCMELMFKRSCSSEVLKIIARYEDLLTDNQIMWSIKPFNDTDIMIVFERM